MLFDLHNALLDAGTSEEQACTAAASAAVVHMRFVALEAPEALGR
jgi:hypothetical protein